MSFLIPLFVYILPPTVPPVLDDEAASALDVFGARRSNLNCDGLLENFLHLLQVDAHLH